MPTDADISKQPPISATLEVRPMDGEEIEETIADAIRRAVPGCDPCTIGLAYVGFKLDGSYYSAKTPGRLAGLYLRSTQGLRVEPLTITIEFPWKEDL